MPRASLLGLDRPTAFGKGARVDRFSIAEGLDGAVFEYLETEGQRRGAVSDRIEIGVQLDGDSVQAGYTACATALATPCASFPARFCTAMSSENALGNPAGSPNPGGRSPQMNFEKGQHRKGLDESVLGNK